MFPPLPARVGREGREIDHRAQNLQIGDQRIHFGQPGWPSKLRSCALRIAFQQTVGIGIGSACAGSRRAAAIMSSV
jgi:hypothetical protein